MHYRQKKDTRQGHTLRNTLDSSPDQFAAHAEKITDSKEPMNTTATPHPRRRLFRSKYFQHPSFSRFSAPFSPQHEATTQWSSFIPPLLSAILIASGLSLQSSTQTSTSETSTSDLSQQAPTQAPTQLLTTTLPPTPVALPEQTLAPNNNEQAMAQDLFTRVNQERLARNLPILHWDSYLTNLAFDWSSQHLARFRKIEHRDLQPLLQHLPQFSGLGENVYISPRGSSTHRMHLSWMESDGHRRNLLQQGFNTIGIGVYCSPNGGVYVTQNFGQRKNIPSLSYNPQIPPSTPLTATQAGLHCN